MDKFFELQGIEFEWDEEKYAANLGKHGVKFEDAASVKEEQRESILGFSYSAKMLFVVFVERRERARIISARPARSQERNDYAERN